MVPNAGGDRAGKKSYNYLMKGISGNMIMKCSFNVFLLDQNVMNAHVYIDTFDEQIFSVVNVKQITLFEVGWYFCSDLWVSI